MARRMARRAASYDAMRSGRGKKGVKGVKGLKSVKGAGRVQKFKSSKV